MIDKQKQYSRQNDYTKQNYDRFSFFLPAGSKEKIKLKADAEGLSVNAWLKKQIEDKI